MKVVHVCSHESGGAFIAARRLHEGLLVQGVDSSLLTIASFTRNVSRHNLFRKEPIPFYTRALARFGLAPLHQKKSLAFEKPPGDFEIFTFPETDYRVENHPLIRNADIVHLHWIANFVNYPTFFEHVTKPIVWTLHDMNPFMGGFHYGGDKVRNPSCEELENQLTALKEQALINSKSISLVAISEWLRDLIPTNSIFQKFPCRVIPNGTDLSVFKIMDKAFSRQVFNFPPEKKIILFVSGNINIYRKGFDLLYESLQTLDIGDDWIIVTAGNQAKENSLDIQVNKVINIGLIRDEKLLCLLYSAADVFILPSREDNFPNVVLEAMACGTPVIAYGNGGMKKVVKSGFNGLIVDQITPEALRIALAQVVKGEVKFDRHEIRQFLIDKYDVSIQASRYRRLYEDLQQQTATEVNN